MASSKDQLLTGTCHVVAMPYPGRGHINPMMNLCKQLVCRNPNLIVTFVVTQEWLGFIGSDHKPDNIRLAAIPNVIPSEVGRAGDFLGFIDAVFTKLQEPFERLLDCLDPPAPAVIIADTYVVWAAEVGNRRNIPVASLWTMSVTMLSFFLHSDRIIQNREPSEIRDDEVVDCIPGVPPTRLSGLTPIFHGFTHKCFLKAQKCFQEIPKAQYLLFTSVYELESQVFDALKSEYHFPVYPVGPCIPYPEPAISTNGNPVKSSKTEIQPEEYIQWLDRQPEDSVLYISLGSFLSVSRAQMDEIVAGIRESEVRFLWVARVDTSKPKDLFGEDNGDAMSSRGLIVNWCDQLRVLCHPSVGGFWTHCGFNSTLEGVYSGVPMLGFPIFWDQITDSTQIVDHWRVGLRVKRNNGEDLVRREQVRDIVKNFMDLENPEGIEMRKRARELSDGCRGAVGKGGSSDFNIEAFIKDITESS